jgi:ABC-type ATPase with predicted acetyltransferase domain
VTRSRRGAPARFPLRIVSVSTRPSETLLRACAGFGIVLQRRREQMSSSTGGRTLLTRLRACRVVLITGPSGSGKSTLVRSLSRAIGPGVVRVRGNLPAGRHRRPIFDCLPGSIGRRLEVLARAGLAEATLLARNVEELSQGQQARFFLAMAMCRVEQARGRWLIADEFTSTLDRVTAFGVAATVGRWVRSRRFPCTVIAATAHHDVLGALRPELVVRLRLDGSFEISSPKPGSGDLS